MKRLTFAAVLLAPFVAACGGDAEEETYVTDTVDQSGGELIVRDADEPRVQVDVPETPMTNVPADEASPPAAADAVETATGQTAPPSE